jgi:hypothetical protein
LHRDKGHPDNLCPDKRDARSLASGCQGGLHMQDNVVLRVLLVRLLLILVWPLLGLVLPLWILIPPLLILIRLPLVLVWPLLIAVRPLIRSPVLPGLELGIAELAAVCTALKTTLAGRGHHGQTKERKEEQDRSGNCCRTQTFRVGFPVHKPISKWDPNGLQLNSRLVPFGAWLPESAEM